MKILYFTATGNSLAVAKRIGNDQAELISIPQAVKNNIYDFRDDVVGVVFPVYCYALPNNIRHFLEKTSIKAEYTFAVATYGMIRGGALMEAQNIAGKQGYQFNYLNAVKMVDNCQPMFDIDKEIELLPSKDVDGQISQVIADISSRIKRPTVEMTPSDKRGTFFCTRIMRLNSDKSVRNFPKRLTIDENCVLCGTCAKVCPTGTIRVTDKVQFGSGCISCQACLHVCPKGAIHVKGEKNSRHWRNPEVSVEELIAANEQDHIS